MLVHQRVTSTVFHEWLMELPCLTLLDTWITAWKKHRAYSKRLNAWTKSWRSHNWLAVSIRGKKGWKSFKPWNISRSTICIPFRCTGLMDLFKGTILTGNQWDFTIKHRGFLHIFPIIQFCDWLVSQYSAIDIWISIYIYIWYLIYDK